MFDLEEGDNKDVVYKDLIRMGEILNHYGMCHDISPISKASEYCRKESDSVHWIYFLEKLSFNNNYIYAPSGTIPEGVKEISIDISVIIKGKYANGTYIENPIIEVDESLPYCFDLEISGISHENSDLYCSWHFDKSFKSSATKFLHPEFHWTFGGKKMENKSIRVGSTFIIPAPRISHPPFDAILAIDYVIKHYIERELSESLLEDSEYIRIVRRSQARLWRPYALSFAAHWLNQDGITFCEDFSAKTIFPELY